jgi:leader peptidase (prepilin peptidase)/N-methyltransferase
MPLAELTPAAAEAILLVWLFAFGACVGSFLNVVIYRLPAGKSLVFPGSHCPACEHPIRWHDNLPVVSWFVLRGRCRDCGSRISFRYPAVEAITGGLFLAVGAVEGISGGANLPLEPVLSVKGMLLPPLDLGQSALVVLYHLVLLSTLLAAAMIEYDGHVPPNRLFGPALVVGGLSPLAWPYLHVVSPELALINRPYAAGMALGDAAAGLLLGGLLALAFSWPRGRRGLHAAWAPACVGLFLGWKPAIVLAVAATVLALLSRGVGKLWPGRRSVPGTLWLGLSALGWILAWGWIVGRVPFLG